MPIDVMTCVGLYEATRAALVELASTRPDVVVVEASDDVARLVQTVADHGRAGRMPFTILSCDAIQENLALFRDTIITPAVPACLIGLGFDLRGPPPAQPLQDLLHLRPFESLLCVEPADDLEVPPMLAALAEQRQTAYLRLSRRNALRVHSEPPPFTPGRSRILLPGSDVTIAACGPAVGEALTAVMDLHIHGIHARVVNVSSIRPLDIDLLIKCAKETGRMVTVAQHVLEGGLGQAVAEALDSRCPTPMRRVSLADPESDARTIRVAAADLVKASR